ncbi:hypothetical protein GNP84_06530 [Aliivibrio fischeri]|uniref:hypothetical protein n=1 Tax=Aliivibrio fischeri TaxID=668 RepID=UPI0012D9CE03|nr:hypothetical protein [Aliivibrio fischeri]MUK76561.1 hypothetical protein [Aliivibrio fischeri]
MSWTVIRYDFTDKVECRLGTKKHYVTSGKGFVIRNENGEEAFCGPVCASNPLFVTNPNDKVPDITMGCGVFTESGRAIEQGTDRGSTNQKADKKIDEKNAAIAYLTLRCNKLAHIRGVKYNALNAIYDEYLKENDLSESDVDFISYVMGNDDFQKYTYKNLLGVYACDYWINYFIENNDNIKYVEKVRAVLHKDLFLEKTQIVKLNNWFRYSDGKKIMKIKENLFSHIE